MNARAKALIPALGLLLLLAAPALAGPQAQAWKIDGDHTSFTFTIRHLLADVPGRFNAFAGTVRFDPRDLQGSAFEVTVKTASVDTGVAKRDEHLGSADFFEARSFPDMRFVSTSVERGQGEGFVVKGRLTIKNTTREVAIPFEFLGIKDNPMVQGAKVAGFRFVFPVVLADFGVSDGRFTRMGILGDTAHVVVNMEAWR